jgi:hypothetical protein
MRHLGPVNPRPDFVENLSEFPRRHHPGVDFTEIGRWWKWLVRH